MYTNPHNYDPFSNKPEDIEKALDHLADLIVEDYLLKKARGKFRPKEPRPSLGQFDVN